MATTGSRQDIRPARSAVVVDVSSTDQTLAVESTLWIGGAGVVEVRPVGTGDAIQFTCVAGTHLPVVVDKVYNANSTATLMVALY
mgnify:FL=1